MVVDASAEALTKRCASDGWDLENFCASLRSHTALLINLLFTSQYYQTLALVLNTITTQIHANDYTFH